MAGCAGCYGGYMLGFMWAEDECIVDGGSLCDLVAFCKRAFLGGFRDGE